MMILAIAFGVVIALSIYHYRRAVPRRRALLQIFAVLIAIRALTNVFKPFSANSRLIFFGQDVAGTNPLAPVLGILMLIYAYGLWNRRGFALPLGIAYAIFATLNIFLFAYFQGVPAPYGATGYALFALVGIGVTWGAVALLRNELSAPKQSVDGIQG